MSTFTDRIQVILDAQTGGLVRGLQQGTSESTKFGQITGTVDDKLKGLGITGINTGTLLKGAVAGGAAVAGAQLVQFGKDSVDAFVNGASAVRDFQRASGASAEDSSRFVAVLDDMNISAETGEKAIFKLGREVGTGGKNLEKFGIEVAKNKDGTDDLTGTLLNVADAYAKSGSQAERNALAQGVFGKAGMELIPILEQGRKGLDEFFASAEKNHQIFTQDDIDKAREYELAIDSLEDAMSGLQRSAGSVLVPTLTEVAGTTATAITQADELSGSFGGLSGVAGTLNQNFNPMMFGLNGASGAMKILSGDFRDGAQQMTHMLGPVGTGIDELGKLTGVFRSGSGETDRYSEAQKRLTDAQKEVYKLSTQTGASKRELTAAQRELTAAEIAYESIQGKVIKNLEDEEDALTRVIAKEQERQGAVITAAASADAHILQQIELNDALVAYVQHVADAGSGSATAAESAAALGEEEVRLHGEFRDAAEAAADHAVATSGVKDANQRTEIASAAYRTELVRQRDAIAPGQPLRAYLDGLITTYDKASGNKHMTFTADGQQAIDEANRVRAALEGVSGAALNALNNTRNALANSGLLGERYGGP